MSGSHAPGGMPAATGVKFDTGGDGLTQQFGGAVDALFQIDTVSDGVVSGTLPPAVNYTFESNVQSRTLNNYVTYSAYAQYVDPGLNLSSLELTGKVLHAFVKLDSGFSWAACSYMRARGPATPTHPVLTRP